MAMKKKSTKQSFPRKKLPKGVYSRGGFTPSLPGLRSGVTRALDTTLKVQDLGAGKAVSLASPAVRRIAETSFTAAGDALTAQAFASAALLAGRYIKNGKVMVRGRGRGRPKGSPNKPKKVVAEDVAVTSSSIGMGVAPRNNALVPDKMIHFKVQNGFYKSNEKKFYTRWPIQTIAIYQSLTHNRLSHNVAPGHKAFWYPFSSNIQSPSVSQIHNYRKGVEMSVANPDSGVSTIPPFQPSSFEYGTVMGGQDFVYPLQLGGYADYCSVLSALTDDSFPARTDRALMANASVKFGTVSNHLSFEIENNNRFYPAQFTVQIHEVIDAGLLNQYAEKNPVGVMWNDDVGIPNNYRGFKTTAQVEIFNSTTGLPDTNYTNSLSLLSNAPTISNLTSFKRIFRTLDSATVALTAGSRLKVDVQQSVAPFDVMDYINTLGTGVTNSNTRKGQLFVTIQAKGMKEVIGKVYADGAFRFNANFATNAVEYTVMSIHKHAKVHAPQIVEKVAGTSGYDDVNAEYIKFTDNMFAFGEQRQPNFQPVGQYDIQYNVIKDEVAASGTSLIFPVLSDQTEAFAGGR